MTAIPKPAKRGRKPPARIPRGRRPARVRQREGRGALRELADDFMSLYIRHRAGWVCVRCGSRKWEQMQNAHVIRKGRYPAGRYADWNTVCLCAPCHSEMTWSELEWDEWCLGFFGRDRLQWIKDAVRVRCGPLDYKVEALYYMRKLAERPDIEHVRERFDALLSRARRLGVI